MARQEGSEYYTSRGHKLLREFDRVAARAEPHLARHYDGAFAIEILADSRARFAGLIADLPYIGGGRNIFTKVMVVNGWILALLRSMQARGKTAEETVRICAETADEFFRSIPAPLRRLAGHAAFSAPAKRMFRKQAARSQERRYAEDFVYETIEREDGELVLEFSECAVNKFYGAQGVTELAPYCNFFDVAYSRLMNMGVDATETLGLGCERCRLRYKHGRETPIPERLVGVLPRT